MVEHVTKNFTEEHHDIKNIVVTMPEGKEEDLIRSSSISIKNLKKLKKNIQVQACKLIEQANSSFNSALSKLASLERQFVALFNNASRNEKLIKSLLFSIWTCAFQTLLPFL